MKNTFGSSLTVSLFGESHGCAIGAVIDGLAPGILIDKSFISMRLWQRKPRRGTGTARTEADDFLILSGEKDGYTTGTPLLTMICGVVEFVIVAYVLIGRKRLEPDADAEHA